MAMVIGLGLVVRYFVSPIARYSIVRYPDSPMHFKCDRQRQESNVQTIFVDMLMITR